MYVIVNCPCPRKSDGGTRHPDGDTVTLKDTLDFRSVTALRSAIGSLEDGSNLNDIYGVLTEGYVVYGIESWSFTDAKGKALPVSRMNIAEHVLTNLVMASDIGDAANEIYGEKVVLPLLQRGANSSPSSPTEPTSPQAPDSTPSSDRRPRPLKPSSTTTTPTDDTATTSSSLDGDSSSSQSSASAA